METGRTIGEYRIVRLLGKGGMAEVYEAEHLRLGSRHALKFFTYDKNMDGVRERFLAEGKLLARLSHPRVVRVTDAGTDPETHEPYFVMDLVVDREGNVRSLADVPKGAADEQQIAEWYEDIREGLAYIHGKGIIHRDLKLENVMIGPDGHAVLTDFGISKIAEAENGAAVVDPVQTIMSLKDGKRLVMGSIGYMAPELDKGVSASPQSDYYALGVIVFHLLTGTWCDVRTDLQGYLETFDPAWLQILPKLLHSIPQGRECLSWRELKDGEAEHRIFEMENAQEKGKRRLWFVSAALLASMVAAIVCGLRLALSGEIVPPVPPPTFDDVVDVSAEAPAGDGEGQAFQEELKAALPDVWVLTHQMFAELKVGKVSWQKLASDLDEMADQALQDDTSSLDRRFGDYAPSGEYAAISKLLRDAASRIRERFSGK